MDIDLIYDCSSCTPIEINNYNLIYMGFIQKKIFLKIHDYTVFCIPYEMSCNRCRLLAALSPKEQIFFKKFEDSIHNFHLAFQDPETMEEISIYINTKIKILKSDRGEHDYCFIDAEFMRPPKSYIKLLKISCSRVNSYKDTYEYSLKENNFIPAKFLDEIRMEPEVVFRPCDKHKFTAKIVKISYSRIEILANVNREISQMKEELSLEFTKAGTTFYVKAHIDEATEVERFYLISLSMDFSCSIIDSLVPLYKYYQKILNEGE